MSPDAVSGPLGEKLSLAEHNRNCFPTVLKARKSKIKLLADSVSGERQFPHSEPAPPWVLM